MRTELDSYTSFSYVYDTFMDQEPYEECADRVCEYLEKYVKELEGDLQQFY